MGVTKDETTKQQHKNLCEIRKNLGYTTVLFLGIAFGKICRCMPLGRHMQNFLEIIKWDSSR